MEAILIKIAVTFINLAALGLMASIAMERGCWNARVKKYVLDAALCFAGVGLIAFTFRVLIAVWAA